MDCECTICALNAHLQGAPTSELLARAYLKAPVGQELVASGKAPTHAQAAVFHSQEQHFLLTSRRGSTGFLDFLRLNVLDLLKIHKS